MKDQKSPGNQMSLLGVKAFATTHFHPFKIISRLSTYFQDIPLMARPMQK